MARQPCVQVRKGGRGDCILPDIMPRSSGSDLRSGVPGQSLASMIELPIDAERSPSALILGRQVCSPMNLRKQRRAAGFSCRASSSSCAHAESGCVRGNASNRFTLERGNASNRSTSERSAARMMSLPSLAPEVGRVPSQSNKTSCRPPVMPHFRKHPMKIDDNMLSKESRERPPIARTDNVLRKGSLERASSAKRKSHDRVARLTRLVDVLLSPEVQVPAPAEVADIPVRFTDGQVADIFLRHVPGVQSFLFRDQAGQYSLKFIQSVYRNGLAAFKGTNLDQHLIRLMRLIVQHGADDGPNASSYLREVAEAFMDCQAIQARTIERVGLSILGVVADFRGLVVRLVGEYKIMALKMLAAERISQLRLPEDANPVHYESRLTMELGLQLGLNANDIRRAAFDQHARQRFKNIPENEKAAVAARCRELFDVQALVQAFAAEVNSFSTESPSNSLPRLFLNWASTRLTLKHIVFDEETCTHVDVGELLAMAILEDLFLGQPGATSSEFYRGQRIATLFSSA